MAGSPACCWARPASGWRPTRPARSWSSGDGKPPRDRYSAAAEHVLAVAFDEASRRGADLTVVRSYLPVLPLWLADVRPVDVATPAADADERARLDEQLAPWRAKHPDVSVEVVLTHAGAAAALVEASTRAHLAIVGSHGHGVIAGALGGSVGLQLLHHADCPVYITRPLARQR